MTLHYENIAEALVKQAPELSPMLQEHLQDYGELLPHVFFADVTRYVQDLYRQSKEGSIQAKKVLKAVLDLLEQAIQSPEFKLQNLICVSFLESLNLEGADQDRFLKLLGPELQKAFHEVHV